MTEHPNYKYRPRRRKHNKQRATSGSTVPPRIGTSLPSPSVPNMSPRYSNYIPNASLSPNVQQNNFTSIGFHSPGASSDYNQQEKRYSPETFSQYGYVGYSQSFPQKSPYSIHTPETSPTQSPEPKNTPSSPQDCKEAGDKNPPLPTPELSPLEHEYDEKQRASNIQHTNSVSVGMSTSNLSPAQQSYNTRVQTYRQNNSSYTNAQPITSVPMANGTYYMCANKSSVEQGHVVTGTFYPPVATSQDQQMLGTSQNNINTIAGNPTNLHYYSANMPHYYTTGKEYSPYDDQSVGKQETFLPYSTIPKSMEKQDYLYKPTTLENPYADYPDGTLVPAYMHTSEERSDVDSDVDTREFDKYLKFSNTESSGVIDSNHNYHRNDTNVNSNLTYNFQAQHTSVILPNTNVKPEPFIGHCPEVYEIAPNGVQKNDDDFSEILAGVRKTCYSN